jgi:cell division protein FtsI/penicillin-binding protein 2
MPTTAHRTRILIVLVPLLMGLMTLGYRLYDLHVFRHQEFTKTVSKLHGRHIRLPALRGMIVDCNENMLAHSLTVKTIVLDPEAVREDEAVRLKAKRASRVPDLIKVVSDKLAIPKAEVQNKLGERGRYVVLKRKVSEEVSTQLREALRDKGVRGIVFEDDQHRVYPNGASMSHVLGFVNSEQRGIDGVELFMQEDLQGQAGWRQIECNRKGEEIVVYRNQDFPARNGCTVVLTLDQAIQNVVEQELDKACQKHRPDSAVVIVMRPSTGEILALANRPTFDPNSTRKEIDSLKNRAIAELNEPGSTFKIVPIAAALDRRIISLSDRIWCENGRFLYAGRYLNDHKPYGSLTVAEGMIYSSNILAAKVALMLGNESMYRAMLRFGAGERAFGDKPDERWPGEVRGIVRPLSQWTKLSPTRVSMGHEVAVTPIQMACAMSALANGGNLMKPMIVKKIFDQSGKVVKEFFPQVRRRVVDQQAARQLIEPLKQVVSAKGTAEKAGIAGYEVAGKTGTAQKIVDGKYVNDKFVASFSGFFPANDPEVSIYVMLDNPKGIEHQGGSVAAPVFRDIGVQIASYLNLKPTISQIASSTSLGVIQTANPGVMP